MRELLASPEVQRACSFFTTHADEITRDHIALCSIPAPPFGEIERARFFEEKLRLHGLSEVSLDAEGNCLGLRRGEDARGGPIVAASAHLDTVFPRGTNCAVRADAQGRLHAPGIADDSSGLAALLALLKALEMAHIKTVGSILFAATVGEEGEGNLRGVRHIFTRGDWAGKIDSFVSFDGPGVERITHIALGSRRYRVRLTGAGGHSWGDFGVPNPVHALGRAIARLAAYPAPRQPRTTFNVGRVAGGTGANVIAQEASMDVDLRSQSTAELQRLDAFFRRAVREAVDDENNARALQTGPLTLELKLIGDRPSGETPPHATLVRLAEEATRALGHRPVLDCSSTDSNVPISLGVPAITLGAGGDSGNSHTLDEWYDPARRATGLKRALLVLLGAAGMEARELLKDEGGRMKDES
ncbi:MAG: M20/M25/M40 family metallo-hydrolase [Pyrinomonadaceae bacterium]